MSRRRGRSRPSMTSVAWNSSSGFAKPRGPCSGIRRQKSARKVGAMSRTFLISANFPSRSRATTVPGEHESSAAAMHATHRRFNCPPRESNHGSMRTGGPGGRLRPLAVYHGLGLALNMDSLTFGATDRPGCGRGPAGGVLDRLFCITRTGGPEKGRPTGCSISASTARPSGFVPGPTLAVQGVGADRATPPTPAIARECGARSARPARQW